MPTNLTARPQLRPVSNTGSQSKGAPGAPIDPLVLGFEGSIQGFIAEVDDAKALQLGLSVERHLLSIFAIDAANAAATDGTSRELQARIAKTRAHIERVHRHLEERVQRLRDNIIPDQKSIVQSLDICLTERAKDRKRGLR